MRHVARWKRALPRRRPGGITRATRRGVPETGVVGPYPRQIVLEDGHGVDQLELVARLRPRPPQPKVVHGLLDGLEHLVEVVSGAPEGHAHRFVAVLAGPGVLGREVEVRRHVVCKAHECLVPADADLVDSRGTVVRAERWSGRAQNENATLGLGRQESRGGRDDMWRLVPQEVELPSAQATDREVVVLVLVAPLGAPELSEEALVGARQAQVESQEEGTGAEVPVLLELRPFLGRGSLEIEPAAGLDLALDVHAAQLRLRRGDARHAAEQEDRDDRAPGSPRSHVFPPIA